MSPITGMPATSYTPNVNQVKSPVAAPQPAHTPTPAVGKDADGDNDGSKGGKINLHA